MGVNLFRVGLVGAIGSLIRCEAFEFQLLDQSVSGERGELQIVLGFFISLFVPVYSDVVDGIDGVFIGKAFKFQLFNEPVSGESSDCLLYTSDAADDDGYV